MRRSFATKRQVLRRAAAALLLLCGVALAGPAAAADEPIRDPMDLNLEGMRALGAGDLEGAVALYSRGIDHPQASGPILISLLLGRARVRAIQGDLDAALADADRAVAHAGEAASSVARGNVYAVRGLLRAETGRRKEARDDFETAYRLLQAPDPEYADMLSRMEQEVPDQARQLRRQNEALLDSVWERLKELRAETP